MITCYLDSQDYSTLTDPRTSTTVHKDIRSALVRLARANEVRFVYSAAAVCEAVPTSPDTVDLAELKAELLSELCGRNAFVSFDRLIAAEVSALAERRAAPLDMLDLNGNWFPEISAPRNPTNLMAEMQQRAEAELATMGGSRQQRRALLRTLIKNGKPRGALRSQMDSLSPDTFAAEILKGFTMKPEYAETMARYVLGRATETEFSEALRGSLRDPHWMMKWFATNHALATPLAEIVRKPGRELGESMRRLADTATRWASALRDSEPDVDPTRGGGDVHRRWLDTVNRQLVSVVERIAGNTRTNLGVVTAEDVDRYCPGWSTAVRALFSSVWDNVNGARGEQTSDSQPVDALHALYAPYVRVFRADRFMAPHIRRQVGRHGTVVVSRLAQLVDVLETEVRGAA